MRAPPSPVTPPSLALSSFWVALRAAQIERENSVRIRAIFDARGQTIVVVHPIAVITTRAVAPAMGWPFASATRTVTGTARDVAADRRSAHSARKKSFML